MSAQVEKQDRKFRITRRQFLIWGGSVAAIAIMIMTFSALSPRDESGTDSVAHTLSAEESIKFAKEALESGDTTSAVVYLEEAIRRDPDNAEARRLLEQVTETDSDAAAGNGDADANGDDSSSSQDGQDNDQGFDYMQPLDDLSTFLPRTIEGYVVGTIEGREEVSIVSADPEYTGPYGIVVRVLLSVHDRETEQQAAAFVENTSKIAYPYNADVVQVNDVQAYFGTNEQRLATVAFARGRYAFEVILVAGQDPPAELKQYAVDAAKAFEASRD